MFVLTDIVPLLHVHVTQLTNLHQLESNLYIMSHYILFYSLNGFLFVTFSSARVSFIRRHIIRYALWHIKVLLFIKCV